MITKIICPIDFSAVAINAGKYASKLAQVMSAELVFVNIQKAFPAVAAVSMGSGSIRNSRENSHMIAERLKEMSAEANKLFKIPTSYEVDITTKSLVKMLSSSGTDNSIIVMGTNGADNTYRHFLGTNTYRVIKNSECPVLVIRKNIPYTNIKKIVFAWDYTSKSTVSFSLLKDLTKALDRKSVV